MGIMHSKVEKYGHRQLDCPHAKVMSNNGPKQAQELMSSAFALK